MNNRKKDIIKGISVLVLYFLFSNIFISILSIFGIHYNNLSKLFKAILSLSNDIILIGIIILIFFNTIKTNFINYKKNIKDYLQKYFKYWLLAFILMLISNFIISLITNIDTSTNQKEVVKIFKELPIYTFIITVFCAPILEELVFRLSFRKIFKNDILFIILSGLIFGSLHLTIASSKLELLYIIPYTIPGIIFAYTLKKSDNIFVPISLHFIHNGFLMIIQILTLFI